MNFIMICQVCAMKHKGRVPCVLVMLSHNLQLLYNSFLTVEVSEGSQVLLNGMSCYLV